MTQSIEIVRKEHIQGGQITYKASETYLIDTPMEISHFVRGKRAQYIRLKVDITANNISDLIEALQEMYPSLQEGA